MKQELKLVFRILDRFAKIAPELDKSVIILCLSLYRFFSLENIKVSQSKLSTIGNLSKELKLSRNTVIKALEVINEKKLFIVKTNNGYPKTVSIFLPSSLSNDK